MTRDVFELSPRPAAADVDAERIKRATCPDCGIEPGDQHELSCPEVSLAEFRLRVFGVGGVAERASRAGGARRG